MTLLRLPIQVPRHLISDIDEHEWIQWVKSGISAVQNWYGRGFRSHLISSQILSG